VVVLYAFDLPPLPEGARYHVWLDLGTRPEPGLDRGPTFVPGARGDAVVAIRLGTPGAALRGVQVVREPMAEPVLAAEVGRSPG
jgi:hypothetical protein